MIQILARSENWVISNEYESAYATRNDGFRICISDHYGDPSCAVIADNESWVAVGGEGLTIYNLTEPFKEYQREKICPQWTDLMRGNPALFIEGAYQFRDYAFDTLRVVVSCNDEKKSGLYEIYIKQKTFKLLYQKNEPTIELMWHPFDLGCTFGTKGSEEGIIIYDEEHEYGARITLEEKVSHAPFAITCGIYGVMFHTVYTKEGLKIFNEMQEELTRLLDLQSEISQEEFQNELDKFVNKY